MSGRLAFAAIAAIAGALAACTDPIIARPSYVAADRSESGTTAAPSNCRLQVTQISDSRLDPTTIGSVAGRMVRGPADSRVWIESALASLRTGGIEMSFAVDAPVPSAGLAASVTLVTAWVSSAATSKIASIVLNVRYTVNGTVLKQVNYRGSISVLNWISTDIEVQGMIDDAMAQILAAMGADLKTICASAQT
jgi:hypothetical protein